MTLTNTGKYIELYFLVLQTFQHLGYLFERSSPGGCDGELFIKVQQELATREQLGCCLLRLHLRRQGMRREQHVLEVRQPLQQEQPRVQELPSAHRQAVGTQRLLASTCGGALQGSLKYIEEHLQPLRIHKVLMHHRVRNQVVVREHEIGKSVRQKIAFTIKFTLT